MSVNILILLPFLVSSQQDNVFVSKHENEIIVSSALANADEYGDKDDLESFNKLVQQIDPAKSADFKIADLKFIAWASKHHLNTIVPTISEELLILVRWNSEELSEYAIYFLRRSPTHSSSRRRLWGLVRPQVSFIKQGEYFAKRPDENDVWDFVKQTNFGNMEFIEGMHVGNVVAYEKFKMIRSRLTKTRSIEERLDLREQRNSAMGRK